MSAIDIVAKHDDEIKVDLLAVHFHSLCHFVLGMFARSAVADNSEAD